MYNEMLCLYVIGGLPDEEKYKKLVRMWNCYKEFHILQLQGCVGDDKYEYEERYVNLY